MYDNMNEFKRQRPSYLFDERCKSNIKLRPYWENSQWRSFDEIEDPFASKFRTNKIFDKKSDISLEALSTIQTPYHGDSLTIDSNVHSIKNLKREQSTSNDKWAGVNSATRTDEYVQNNLKSIINVKMRPFYKQFESRSKSVQKKYPHFDINSSYISYTHMPCSQMAKNSRVSNITSLPKIRSVSRKEEMMPCDTQQTLAMTSLNDDNSLVYLDLLKPLVVPNDFPKKEELEEKWRNKLVAHQKIKRIRPFHYLSQNQSDSAEKAEERLKITPNIYGQIECGDRISKREETFKRKLDNIIKNLYPEILSVEIPLSRKIELVKYRYDAKANASLKLLGEEVADLLEWFENIEKSEELRIKQKNRRNTNIINLTRNYSTVK